MESEIFDETGIIAILSCHNQTGIIALLSCHNPEVKHMHTPMSESAH